MGVFSLQTWRAVLRGIGFAVREDRYDSGDVEYLMLVGIKPD